MGNACQARIFVRLNEAAATENGKRCAHCGVQQRILNSHSFTNSSRANTIAILCLQYKYSNSTP